MTCCTQTSWMTFLIPKRIKKSLLLCIISSMKWIDFYSNNLLVIQPKIITVFQKSNKSLTTKNKKKKTDIFQYKTKLLGDQMLYHFSLFNNPSHIVTILYNINNIFILSQFCFIANINLTNSFNNFYCLRICFDIFNYIIT